MPPPPMTPPGYSPYGGGAAAQSNSKATSSMVCGIVGLLICGIVLGPIAIVLSSQAKREIAASPGRYTNAGMATAGQVLGIIAVAVSGIFIAIIAS
jgi:hypothetical protein